MTIKEMIEKRAKVWETAKDFVDTHENENGVLSAEDSAAASSGNSLVISPVPPMSLTMYWKRKAAGTSLR